MADDTKACASQDHSPPVVIKSEPAAQLPQDVLATSPLVKLIVAELAQDESLMQLVASSSSPPPLTPDRPESLVSSGEATKHDEVKSLRNQLELSAYEYAALEERYRTLQVQHSESRKLGQTFNDVIYGSSSYEDQTVSIEQLRAEAGYEGLRAKALKLDAIRPIIRGAGGLQLMMTQAQSISSLIEDAGGLEELRALVADAHMLRFRVHEVGGLDGIDDLISQVNVLKSSRQELVELKAQLDKPDGLRAKVQKYSKLQQAFYAIETGATFDSTRVSQSDAYPLTHGAKSLVAATGVGQPAPTSIVGMNPARAQLLTKAPTRDPNRDLYEPKPPVTNPHNKTGSNDVPLGQPRGGKRSEDLGSKAFEKRRHDGGERVPSVVKRPRVDLGRASALVQATLAPSNARSATSTSNTNRISAPSRELPLDYGEDRLEATKIEAPGFVPCMQQGTSVQPDARHASILVERASVESLLGPAQQYDQPPIKQEDTNNDLYSRTLGGTSIPNAFGAGPGSALVAGYPIALWAGAKKPANHNPFDLIKAVDIPSDLTDFLVTEMTKHLTAPYLEKLRTVPANLGTCIFRLIIDGYKPIDSGQQQRACRTCASVLVAHNRPCALLQDIDGVRTVLFLPLPEHLRQGVTIFQRQFWLMNA